MVDCKYSSTCTCNYVCAQHAINMAGEFWGEKGNLHVVERHLGRISSKMMSEQVQEAAGRK